LGLRGAARRESSGRGSAPATAPGVLETGPPGPRWGLRRWARLFLRDTASYGVYSPGEKRLTRPTGCGTTRAWVQHLVLFPRREQTRARFLQPSMPSPLLSPSSSGPCSVPPLGPFGGRILVPLQPGGRRSLCPGERSALDPDPQGGLHPHRHGLTDFTRGETTGLV